ncbi:hypothetical protein MTR_5g024973 [Medicago truncatula]|uniref:Uncharacterized protein n=1 Tax=Medicago truncatula TaxID=3880 RepID=A0A072UDD9_MEDTR|nr:hypothetical protein MTR_5g024973 [Medicago truncatula]
MSSLGKSVELGRERSSTAEDDAHIILAVNHALITRSWFIHQTYVPVSLEIKDTVVRSYRTDPVQVRSCLIVLSFSKTKAALVGLPFQESGAHFHEW